MSPRAFSFEGQHDLLEAQDPAPYTGTQGIDLGPQDPALSPSGQAPASERTGPQPTTEPAQALGPASPTYKWTPTTEKPQSHICHGRTQPIHQQANTRFKIPETPWPAVSGSNRIYQWLDTSSGALGLAARSQDLALPTSGPALAPESGFTRQWRQQSPDLLGPDSTNR
ncbi:unnamed protein product [Rangifer tarandus platyrhynchus]|uniref:Uncharacterized protein n=1 Tax=Rangifer tarandus platyrhynchus TaxID=3082113 RepID=A0AC59ZG95_RANTA